MVVYQALLAASYSQNDPGEMVEIFEDMKARGIEVHSHSHVHAFTIHNKPP